MLLIQFVKFILNFGIGMDLKDIPSCDWNLNTLARRTMLQMARESEIRKWQDQYVDWAKYVAERGAASAPTPTNYESR